MRQAVNQIRIVNYKSLQTWKNRSINFLQPIYKTRPNQFDNDQDEWTHADFKKWTSNHSPQKLLNPCQQRGHYTAKIYVSTCRDKLRHESAVIYLPKHYEKTCATLHHHWNWFDVVVLQRRIVVSDAASRANKFSVCRALPTPHTDPTGGGCFRNWVNGWNYGIGRYHRPDRDRTNFSL